MPPAIHTKNITANVDGRFKGAELRLLESGRLSDCQVSVGSRTWNLHKFIICDRSDYFDRAFCGNFAEAANNKVVISESDMDGDYFDWIVRWLYSGGLALEVGDHTHGISSVVCMFIYADYLGIEPLCAEVSDSIGRHAAGLNAKPPITTKVHEDHPSDWVEAMRLFYVTFLGEEKRGLKSAMFDLCLLNRKFREQVLKLEKLEDFVVGVPVFCQDLTLEILQRKLYLA